MQNVRQPASRLSPCSEKMCSSLHRGRLLCGYGGDEPALWHAAEGRGHGVPSDSLSGEEC